MAPSPPPGSGAFLLFVNIAVAAFALYVVLTVTLPEMYAEKMDQLQVLNPVLHTTTQLLNSVICLPVGPVECIAVPVCLQSVLEGSESPCRDE